MGAQNAKRRSGIARGKSMTRRRVMGRRVWGGVAICGLVLVCCEPVTAKDRSVDEAIRAIASDEASTGAATQPSDQQQELRIVSARYGAQGTWVDVTDHLRQQVREGSLSVWASNGIAGDPIYGVPKALRVIYQLDGQVDTCQVGEGEKLRIPAVAGDLVGWRAIRTPEQLVALAQACPAEIGLYGENLVTGRTVAHRPDQPFCLASIVKLFVLTEVAHQCEQGELQYSETIVIRRGSDEETVTIDQALDAMIGLSDNEATGALAARVGYDRVNAVPGRLGLSGLSDQSLPEAGGLDGVLDKRIRGPRNLPDSELPFQHGTARSMAQFLKLLSRGQAIDARVSSRVSGVLARNLKPFAAKATPVEYKSVGKGGSMIWIRLLSTPYTMVGWALLIYDQDDRPIATFCLLAEWFPLRMDAADRGQWQIGEDQWCETLSNCIVNILLESTAPTTRGIPARSGP